MRILGEGWDALKRLAAIDTTLNYLEKAIDGITEELREMGRKVSDLQTRVVRLEAQHEADKREREADKREFQAEIARFKLEAERFEMRISRQLLPPSDDK